MKQAILIIAHKNFEHLLRLIKYFDGACDLYIHVDKKSLFTKDEIVELKNSKGVRAVYQKYHLNWGSFSILKTEIFLLKQAVKNGKYSYFHLLSGQDYPIKPLNQFLDFFKNADYKGYLSCIHMPNEHLDNNTMCRLQNYYFMDIINYKSNGGGKRIYKIMETIRRLGFRKQLPKDLEHFYCGSAWFSIDKDLVDYLLFRTKYKPCFYWKMWTTFVPEEIYVSTIVLNSPFKNLIDIDNNCRRILWDKSIDIDSPQNAEMKHFRELIAVPEIFFCRKFELPQSNTIIDNLDKYVLYPSNIKNKNNGIYDGINFNEYDYDWGLKNELIDFCKNMDVKSVLDLECGSGWYVSFLNEASITAVGYDANPDTENISKLINNGDIYCHVQDITKELTFSEKFDLTLLLNVGQNIHPNLEKKLWTNIEHCTQKYLLISWDSVEALNRVSKDYVRNKLKSFNFYENLFASYKLRNSCSYDTLRNNLML